MGRDRSGRGLGRRRRSIVDLALSRFIRKDGASGESYLATWQPTPGIARAASSNPGTSSNGPGCCFAANAWHARPLRDTALRLIEIGR